MRVALAGLTLALLTTSCAVPRPVDLTSYVQACPDSKQSPAAATALFMTLRLPDCRAAQVQLTKWRAERLRFASIGPAGILFHERQAWVDEVKRRLADHPGAPVLFIHGFNNSNQQALDRAAKIQRALRNNRQVVVLTWPSYARKSAYFWDEANAEWAQDYVPQAIDAMMAASPDVVLIGHSMGNRLVLAGVNDLRAHHLLNRIEALIMASPDVDRQELQRALAPPLGLGLSPTIYVSAKDQALSTSWRFHGYPRAGDFSDWITGRRPYYAFPDEIAEVIDTTQIDSSTLGHSAFIDAPAGAADLCRVILRTPAKDRDVQHRHGTPSNYLELIGLGTPDACWGQ
jgi:esterase/lipase superfamily enzyme